MTSRYEFIDPIEVYFTHSRIRPFFSGCGRRVLDTLSDIENGRLDLSSLPTITILENGQFFFSLNNRRLYVLKELRKKGLLPNDQIRVRIKQANPQECTRYVVGKCALNASIMKEFDKNKIENDNKKDENPNDDDGDDDDDVNEDDIYDKNSNDRNNVKQNKVKQNDNIDSNNLDPIIVKSLKGLMKLVDKGKNKLAEQQIDIWLDSKKITQLQKNYIMEEIGL